MSSPNAQSREELVRKLQELAAAMDAEQDARIEQVKADVARLASEGVSIRLMIEPRKVKAAKEGMPARGKLPPKYRATNGDQTWSGIGPTPGWVKSGRYVELQHVQDGIIAETHHAE